MKCTYSLLFCNLKKNTESKIKGLTQMVIFIQTYKKCDGCHDNIKGNWQIKISVAATKRFSS